MMMNFIYLLIHYLLVGDINSIEVTTQIPAHAEKMLGLSRRIINGAIVLETEEKPYMVYLKLPKDYEKKQAYKSWLCGGAIIHEDYVITSAACIEDADHFYVVAGTSKFSEDDDRINNPCLRNGGKKAIWKCIPKNYVFDGHENDNLRWMNNDIAIIKVEDGFDFDRRVRGCEYTPKPIAYNNQTLTLENPGTVTTLAGWGSTSKYNDWVNSRRFSNQEDLLEAKAEIIPKSKCKRRWGSRYHNIIDNYMICTKDIGSAMSEICNERYIDCEDIDYSDEEEGGRRTSNNTKTERIPTNLIVHTGRVKDTPRYLNGTPARRTELDGGFCENDHGGPLVYGDGANSIMIGVISACLVKETSNKCHGPFLYTSVYKNKQFISCAIYKDVESKCRRSFRTGVDFEEKFITWKDHPDGPAKNEIKDKAESKVPGEHQAVQKNTTVPHPKVFPILGNTIKAT